MQDRSLQTLVDGIIAPRRLLDHPFYVRWTRGELTRDELRSYAAQYRHFEAHLPGLLDRAAAATDSAALRAAALENLADETAPGRAHIDLFDGFIAGIEATPESPSPAMTRLIGTYDTLLSQSASAALAAVLAYERQSPDVAATKAAGLREHYGLDGAAVEFWDVHAYVDGDHARWLTTALQAACESPDELTEAAREACDAWLGFLDEREASSAAAVP